VIAKDDAERQRDIALSRFYAGRAIDQLGEYNWELALLLAVEAGKLVDTFEARDALRQVFAFPGRTLFIMEGHEEGIRSAAWSPDRSMIATAGDEDFTFRVWDGTSGELIRAFDTDGHEVVNVSWSPDGRHLLASGYDYGFAVVDSQTWDFLYHNEDEGSNVIWHSDGTMLVGFDRIGPVAGSRFLTFNAGTGELINTFATLAYPINSNDLSHNESKLITWESDLKDGYQGKIVDIRTGEVLASIPSVPILGEAYWSFDDSKVATVDKGGEGYIYDAVSGELILAFPKGGAEDYDSTGAWHPASELFMISQCGLYKTWCYDSNVHIWNITTGEEISKYAGILGHWNPDGSLIFTFREDRSLNKNFVKILNTETGGGVESFYSYFPKNASGVGNPIVQWDANSNLVLTCGQGGAQIWSATSKTVLAQVPYRATTTNFEAEWDQERNYILVRDVKTLIRDPNPNARVITMNPGVEIPAPISYLAGNAAVAWAPGGDRYLTSGCVIQDNRGLCTESQIHLWDRESGELLRTFTGHTNVTNFLNWNAAGDKFLSTSWDKTVRLWDAESGKELLVLELPGKFIEGAFWNPDETRILTYISSTFDRYNFASIWDAETGERILQIAPQDTLFDVLHTVSWNKDGSQVLTYYCREEFKKHYCYAQIWDVETGDAVWRVDHVEGQYGGIASWNLDETLILTGSSNGVLRVWDVASEEDMWSVQAHEANLLSAAWSPDGQWIATGGADNVLNVYDGQSGEQVRSIPGFKDSIREVVYTRDGCAIVTRSDDGVVQFWDSQTGDEITRMDHGSYLTNIDISDDGRFLLTASEDGMVRVWYTQLDDLSAAACRIAPRNMTEDEWQLFFPDSPYRATCP